jgi:hypothetical protein
MNKFIVILATCLLLTACSDVDEPNYTLLSKSELNQIEIREYAPTSIAYVMRSGERDEAVNAGFRPLFNYITGDNSKAAEIPMTAPVAQLASQEIQMTAPVTQQAIGEGQWKVVFYMPDDMEYSELPTPTNAEVKLEKLTAEKRAVIQFSGSFETENLQEHEGRLREYLKQKEISFTEPAIYAGYNPPWTPWFMRRNEVMFTLKGEFNESDLE